MAQKLLGSTGEYVIIFLILMAIMSTGSAEVIAVASIIIYDIYQVKISVKETGIVGSSNKRKIITRLALKVLKDVIMNQPTSVSVLLCHSIQAYIKPFRKDLKDDNCCILCGNPMKHTAAMTESSQSPQSYCHCSSSQNCEGCKVTTKNQTLLCSL